MVKHQKDFLLFGACFYEAFLFMMKRETNLRWSQLLACLLSTGIKRNNFNQNLKGLPVICSHIEKGTGHRQVSQGARNMAGRVVLQAEPRNVAALSLVVIPRDHTITRLGLGIEDRMARRPFSLLECFVPDMYDKPTNLALTARLVLKTCMSSDKHWACHAVVLSHILTQQLIFSNLTKRSERSRGVQYSYWLLCKVQRYCFPNLVNIPSLYPFQGVLKNVN